VTTELAAVLRQTTQRLRQAGVEAPAREARLLASAVLAADPAALLARPGRMIDADQLRRLGAAADRRAAREPLSHILGYREFWSLGFRVDSDVLDPRPDSETLVEAGLAALAERDRPWRLLDLGTGSGCLLLALLSELPAATGIGIDRSPAALRLAADNAHRLGLAGRALFACGDWGAGLAGGFDLVLCNPPYIPSAAIAGLAPEVALHEPRLALDGGPDGLACYRRLAPQLAPLTARGGRIVLELGEGQADAVAALMIGAGLAVDGLRPDLAGRARAIVLRPAAVRTAPPAGVPAAKKPFGNQKEPG
jgi:release factor glutamine methyltransferase